MSFGSAEGEGTAGRLDGLVVGGPRVKVKVGSVAWRGGSPGAGEVVLRNVHNEDDFNDEECLAESVVDITKVRDWPPGGSSTGAVAV